MITHNGDRCGMAIPIFMSATLTSPLPRPRDRALADSSSLFCRVVEKDGRVIGFAMCVLHEGTWSTAPVCYLEDLFVDAAERGAGAGKALIDALIDEGKREGWSKLYWVTRMNNPARKLYDHYGEADDYVRYRISL